MQSADLNNGQQQRSSAIGDPADVQLLKEWNIDRFFSRDDEKRHSTQSAIVSPVTNNSGSGAGGVKEVSAAGRLERQVHREIISSKPKQTIAVQSPGKNSSGDNKDKLSGPSAPPTESGGNFMKNFSFIKNFKREKSDLFPMSKRHSSEISYNVNVTKYISAAGSPGSVSGPSAAPNRSSVMERSASGTARNSGQVPSGASLLRAGPRREKTESVILRRNSTQVTAKQAEDARVRASIISRAGLGEVNAVQNNNSSAGAAAQSINNNNSNPNMIDLKSNVAGEGGSRFYGDQVIFNLLLCR